MRAGNAKPVIEHVGQEIKVLVIESVSSLAREQTREDPTARRQDLRGCDGALRGAHIFSLQKPECYNRGLRGGYSSVAERVTVAHDVVGSIPTSRPSCTYLPR